MKRRNALYLRYLLPYVAMIALPLVVGGIAYRQALRIMSEDVERSTEEMVGWTADSIGQAVRDIISMSRQIENDTLVRDFQRLTDPYLGANTFQVVRTINHLYDYRITTDLLLNYFVYFPQNGLVLGPRFACGVEDFPNDVLSLRDVSAGDLIETITGSYPFGVFLPLAAAAFEGAERTVMIYLRSFSYPSYSNGVIIVILDGAGIHENLDRVRISGDAWARITDGNGTVIAHVGPEPRESGGLQDKPGPAGRMLIVTRTSAELDWTVEAGQPYADVMAKVAGIRRSALLIAGIVVLFGACAALVMAFWNYRPIDALLDVVRGVGTPDASDGIFRYLERSVRTVVSDRTRLAEAVAVQTPFLRMALADQLLRGHVDPDQLQSLSRQAGVDWASLRVVAAIATVQSAEGSNGKNGGNGGKDNGVRREIRVVLSKAVETSFAAGGFLTILDSQSDALVLCLDDPDPAECGRHLARFVSEVNRHLFDLYGSGLSFSFGSFRTDPLQLSESFDEARRLAARRDHDGNLPLFWDGPEASSGSYHFPERVETRLMNAVRAGNGVLASEILSSVIDENMKKRTLGDFMLTVFRFELIGMVTKLCEELRIDDPAVGELVEQVSSGDITTAEHRIELLSELLGMMCSGVNERRKGRTAALVALVRRTIDGQIANPDLGLALVAERHNLSEVYLSRIFKEHTGENFLHYVECSRASAAMDLLRSTPLSVDEIARRVGYRSSNTFCKAFRRITGSTAGAYRAGHAVEK